MSKEKDKSEKASKEKLKLLAERLKNLRFLMNMTQKDFAGQIGFTSGYLSEVEKGKYSPGFIFYYNIAKVFKVNLNYLFFGEGDTFHRGITLSVDDRKRFGGEVESVEEMLWYLENSPLVRSCLLGFYRKFMWENEIIIDKDVQSHEKEKKETEDEGI